MTEGTHIAYEEMLNSLTKARDLLALLDRAVSDVQDMARLSDEPEMADLSEEFLDQMSEYDIALAGWEADGGTPF